MRNSKKREFALYICASIIGLIGLAAARGGDAWTFICPTACLVFGQYKFFKIHGMIDDVMDGLRDLGIIKIERRAQVPASEVVKKKIDFRDEVDADYKDSQDIYIIAAAPNTEKSRIIKVLI